MLRSGRFWLAVFLTALLIICLIWRKNQHTDSGSPPVGSIVQVTTAVSESVQTETSTVTTAASETDAPPQTATDNRYVTTASEPYISADKLAETREKLAQIAPDCPDLIGWIYMADSDIDYPVVQGDDNMFYLSHSPDRREYQLGSILLDYRCDKNWNNCTNILFGHNMESGMFGDIRSFKDEENFNSHRYGWIVTPDKVFRIDFFALSIVSGYDAVYDVPCDDVNGWLGTILDNAMYSAGMEYSSSDRFVALSTCASEYETARALFTGKLTEMNNDSDYLR